MKRWMNLRRWAACFVLTVATICASSWNGNLFAQSAHSDVQASLDSLNSWLAKSDYRDGWNSYLNPTELQQQLDQGGNADLEVVQRQLDLYSGNNSGLRKQAFVDVRESLKLWIDELQSPSGDALQELATSAVAEVEPIDEGELQAAKDRLTREGEQLENYLNRASTATQEGWKTYLRWDELTTELAEESPDRKTLVQVWALFASDTPGLQYPRFASYRQALQNYLEVSEFFADENNALKNLPQQLSQYSKKSNEESAAKLGRALAWLERTGQGDEAVDAIRTQFAKPNMFVDFSSNLVTYGFAEQVDQYDPITSYNDGTSTRGQAHTVADVTAALSPNGSRGEITVSMDGTMKSTTRSSNNSGVTFNTNGTTSIDAEKPIYFVNGRLESKPATARCYTDNTTYNIRANSAQVQNIAQQRIAQSERSNEYQAARRAEDRVESDLNKRVNSQVSDANAQIQENFFTPLSRRGVTLRSIQSNSTRERLSQRMVLASAYQLAADTNPPAMELNGDVTARIHTSWVDNFADISLRGSILTDEGLAEALEEWRGEVPEELQITDDSEPWDITLAAERPMRMELADGRLTFTLRGERFTARDRVQNEPMHISASYQVKTVDGKVKLVRDGEVQVSFPAQGDKLPTRMIATRNFWRTKFSALFEEEFTDLNMPLDGAWESAGPLQLTDIATHDNGWLSLAWAMPAGESEADDAATVDEVKSTE